MIFFLFQGNVISDGLNLMISPQSGMLLTLSHIIPTFKTLYQKPFENIVGKGENASN